MTAHPADPTEGRAPGHDARVVVTRGGTPSAPETAALVAVLASVAGPPTGGPVDPPWARAARLEATGAGRVPDPAALAAAEGRHAHRRTGPGAPDPGTPR